MDNPWEIRPLAWGLVSLLAVMKLMVHVLTSGAYGYFRDELYFLACARHLQWGYVDDAPGIAVYSKIALLLGGSLPAVRFLPALAGAATVLLAALLAREMGGERFAQGFAGLCVLAAPIFLGLDSILCVGAFEPLFWMGCALLAIRIARNGESRLWIGFGVVAGLGLENKYTMLLVLACFFAALALSPLRRELGRPLFWAGAGLALLIFLPALIWQVRNHFPLLEDMENIRRLGKNVVLGPFEFVRQQIEFLDPLLLPVWLSGLAWLFVRRRLRVLGWLYVLMLVAMIALHGKNYYLAAIYPMLFAAGAVAIEKGLDRWAWSRDRTWPKASLAGLAVITFVVYVPALLPCLPPQGLLAYQKFLGMKVRKLEVNHESLLDQRLSDQFGWPELAREVAQVYRALPPEERARTAIFAGNYGEAGAIDLYGPSLGLPTATCAHQAYFFWGPPPVEPATVICLGCDRKVLEQACTSVIQVGEHYHPWGMGFENGPIYLVRGQRTPLSKAWPRLKNWN